MSENILKSDQVSSHLRVEWIKHNKLQYSAFWLGKNSIGEHWRFFSKYCFNLDIGRRFFFLPLRHSRLLLSPFLPLPTLFLSTDTRCVFSFRGYTDAIQEISTTSKPKKYISRSFFFFF